MLEKEVFGELILLPNEVSHFFVNFPIGFITIWFLELIFISYGSVANKADFIVHAIDLD